MNPQFGSPALAHGIQPSTITCILLPVGVRTEIFHSHAASEDPQCIFIGKIVGLRKVGDHSRSRKGVSHVTLLHMPDVDLRFPVLSSFVLHDHELSVD
jgi:hypothetical protein